MKKVKLFLSWQRAKLEYKLDKFGTRFLLWFVWLLPKRLVRWCVIRAYSEANKSCTGADLELLKRVGK